MADFASLKSSVAGTLVNLLFGFVVVGSHHPGQPVRPDLIVSIFPLVWLSEAGFETFTKNHDLVAFYFDTFKTGEQTADSIFVGGETSVAPYGHNLPAVQ